MRQMSNVAMRPGQLLRFHWWILPLLAGLAIGFALLGRLNEVRSALPVEGVRIHGAFKEGGGIPWGERVPGGGRQWCSWEGDDALRGRIEIGPFTAPPVIAFFTAGYVRAGQNRIFLRHEATGEMFVLKFANAGEHWWECLVRLPTAWRGAPVTLVAVDDADGWGGWLALAEMRVVPTWVGWWRGFVPWLHALVVALAGFFLLASVAGTWLVARRPQLLPAGLLLAGGIVSLAAYLMFWICFAAAPLGTWAAWAITAAAALTLVVLEHNGRVSALWRQRDWWMPALLMGLIGIAYLTTLCWFEFPGCLSDLAANRFCYLPIDNVIPQLFAERLLQGPRSEFLLGDWLSSDRPPLQTGWILLLAQPLLVCNVDYSTVAQLTGIVFQLLWIPGVWAWLRSLKVSPGAVALVILAIAPTGVLLMNTVFVWPKLGAAALMLGAFALWFPIEQTATGQSGRFAVGGGLAALAWLAHGGVGFALLGAMPLALIRLRATGLRCWLVAGGIFLATVFPWSAYQRFYDPPGDRLLKQHLAGAIARDQRNFGTALADAYSGLTATDWWHTRVANANNIIGGSWRDLFTFTTTAPNRRDQEFFHLFFACGWWNLGFLAGLLATLHPGWRRRFPPGEGMGLAAAGFWVATTLAIWIVLMFIPNSTVIHQGSYTTLLVLLAGLALVLWRLHPLLLGLTAAAQLAVFPAVWLTPTTLLANQPVFTGAAFTLVLVVAGLGLLAFRAWRTAIAPGAD